MTKKATIESTAEAYLELLAARGVEYLFGNAGTDFAPVIEAYARRGAHGQLLPRPITVPHEAPAVGMAHGYAMITGRPQAVMVHVIVGTANALGGVINAARGNVPMLFTAGRNPITEAGFRGSRERQIQLGAGVLRSGCDGARIRQVGLRAQELRPARDRRGPRPRDHSGRAPGTRLSHAAQGGAGRAARERRVQRPRARSTPERRGRRSGRDRGGRAPPGRGADPRRHHQGPRAGAARRR